MNHNKNFELYILSFYEVDYTHYKYLYINGLRHDYDGES